MCHYFELPFNLKFLRSVNQFIRDNSLDKFFDTLPQIIVDVIDYIDKNKAKIEDCESLAIEFKNVQEEWDLQLYKNKLDTKENYVPWEYIKRGNSERS